MAICNFNGQMGYFMNIWYIFPVLVSRTKKNLATLLCPIAAWSSGIVSARHQGELNYVWVVIYRVIALFNRKKGWCIRQ
jgi:hypothetical protein